MKREMDPEMPEDALTLYLHRHYAAETARSYRRDIRDYAEHLCSLEQSGNAFVIITRYLGALRGRYGARTIKKKLCAIKAYYAFNAEINEKAHNPTIAIRLRDKINKDVQLQDLLDEAGLEGLLTVVTMVTTKRRRSPELALRNEVLMGLMVYQGLRLKEITTLETCDIDVRSGTIHITGGDDQIRTERVLSLKVKQMWPLTEYIEKVRPVLAGKSGIITSQLLLTERGQPLTAASVKKYIQRWYGTINEQTGKRARINPTTIRQSVIAGKLKAGKDLIKVQAFCGHKHPSSTERYKAGGTDGLKAAIERCHPVR